MKYNIPYFLLLLNLLTSLNQIHAIEFQGSSGTRSWDMIANIGINDLAIFSKACVIDSRIDDLQDIICSKSDTIIRKIEEIVITNTTSDPDGFISVFGSQLVQGTDDSVSIQFQYGISDFNVQTTTLLMSTTTLIESSAVIRTDGATPGSAATIQSKRNLRYSPGHEGFAFFTAAFTGVTDLATAGSTQWIGLLDDLNGYAVGYDGPDFSILHRRNGVDTTVSQLNFNVDPLNGFGPSGINLKAGNLNVYRISYGWLGSATITFRIMGTDGTWHIFHVIRRPGTAVGPSILNPILPMQAQVLDTAGTNALELRTASWNAGIIGDPSNAGYRYFSKSNQELISSTESHLLTIKNRNTFDGKPNKIEVRIAAWGGGPLVNNAHLTILRLLKNATVTGTSFTLCPNSVIGSSTTGTYSSSSTETEIFIDIAHAQGNGGTFQFIPKSDFEVILLPGETITITARSLTGNETTLGEIAWEERF